MRTLLVSSIAAVMLSASTAITQTPGLAAHWKFDETTGTTASDSSGLKNHGTLKGFVGTPWTTGKVGGAIAFDGTGYVEVAPQGALPVFDAKGSPYTIAFWVKGGPQQNDKRIYCEGNINGNNYPLFTIGTGRTSNQTDSKLQVFIRNDSNQNIINWQSDTTVFDNQWHHVAWVDNAGMASLYIDGKPDTRSWDYRSYGPQTRGFGTFTTDTVAIGAVVRSSVCCNFTGAIDDMRVYRFALAASDIAIIINTPAHPSCRASIGKFGFGCGTGPLDIHAVGSAAIGQTMTVRILRGPPNGAAVLLLGGGLAPQDLTAIGWTDCSLYVSLLGLTSVAIGTLDATGTSVAIPLKVPNNMGLDCVQLGLQGLAIGGSPPKPELSSALLAQFGR